MVLPTYAHPHPSPLLLQYVKRSKLEELDDDLRSEKAKLREAQEQIMLLGR